MPSVKKSQTAQIYTVWSLLWTSKLFETKFSQSTFQKKRQPALFQCVDSLELFSVFALAVKILEKTDYSLEKGNEKSNNTCSW